MNRNHRWTTALRAAALIVAVSLPGAPGIAEAQSTALALHTAGSGDSDVERSSALARGRYAVVIDLDRNKLYFKKGEITLWSAPVGTGTGMRLKSERGEWKFSTPSGTFQVKYKEQNPVWVAPNWYFVENGLPIPGPNESAKRLFPGGLGAAAVYIEDDLAIHGTNKPELLGQRVSHGCIRLANKDAIRLYHNVQVGTEVIIVGGEEVEEQVVTPEQLIREKQAKATFDPAGRTAPKDPVLEEWKGLPTEELLVVLENEIWLNDESSRWPEVANLLLNRGLKEEDDVALKALMLQAMNLPTSRLEREYATFLADAYGRGAMRTLSVLSSLDEEKRGRVAQAIVEATLNLYHGEFSDSAAPWPTARVPRSAVDPDGEKGWEVLAEAERAFRGGAQSRPTIAQSAI